MDIANYIFNGGTPLSNWYGFSNTTQPSNPPFNTPIIQTQSSVQPSQSQTTPLQNLTFLLTNSSASDSWDEYATSPNIIQDPQVS